MSRMSSGRGFGDGQRDNHSGLRPVEKIELNENHLTRRFVLMAVFFVLGIGLIVYSLSMWLSVEPGWTTVDVGDPQALPEASDFVFTYKLGVDVQANSAGRKALVLKYTQYMGEALQLLDADTEYEGVTNLATLNTHPNELLEVDPALYQILSLLNENEERSVFLSGVKGIYSSLLLSKDDLTASLYDPYYNEESMEVCREVAEWISDPDSIRIVLEDGKAGIFLSEAYQKYAEESEIETLIDLGVLKNAFVIDYVCDKLDHDGYGCGVLVSTDGYLRSTGTGGDALDTRIYGITDGTVVPAATTAISGKLSLVHYKSYALNADEEYDYYRYENGEVRTPYIDPETGLCLSEDKDLYAYSEEKSAGEIAVKLLSDFRKTETEEEILGTMKDLKTEGIFAFSLLGKCLYYTESAISFTSVYEGSDGFIVIPTYAD